jgi:hypothetical protein
MLQRMSVALISPPSSNRSLPVRRYAVFVWFITGAITFGIALNQSDSDIIIAWMSYAIICICLSIIWGLGENSTLSMRVKRTIPHNPIIRRLAFLFYNGPAAALFWGFWMTLLTLVAANITTIFVDGYFDEISEAGEVMCSLFFYSVAYGLTAVFIWRKFLSEKLRPAGIGIIACVLIAIGALLPLLISMVIQTGISDWEPAWHIGNIFTINSDYHRETHLLFSVLYAILAVFINGRWIMTQMKDFKNPNAKKPEVKDQVAEVGDQQA